LLPYYGKILQGSTQKLIGKAFSEKFANRNYKEPNTNKNEKEYGKIANPVVHQVLNELRKLINEIITVFGKKHLEIGLETARELKKSKKDREILSKHQIIVFFNCMIDIFKISFSRVFHRLSFQTLYSKQR
jgi:CRISPR-associated endonuclease Csn1